MATIYTEEEKEQLQEESSMSFLEHLDELRKRLVRIAAFVMIAFIVSWIFSDRIYDFLQVPVQKAIFEAKLGNTQKLPVPIEALIDQPDDTELLFPLPKEFTIGSKQTGYILTQPGTSVLVKVQHDENGLVQLVTAKPCLINEDTVLKAGYVIPRELYSSGTISVGSDGQLVVGTVQGAFNLYIKVTFFAAIFFAVPIILVQAWGFIAPGLYPHEKRYAIPLILMASVCFIVVCAFAY